MAQREDKPKLAAILTADLQGCSQLVGEDEEMILAALRAHGKELIEPDSSDGHAGLVD